MKKSETRFWTDIMLRHLKAKNPSLDFSGRDVVVTELRKKKIYILDCRRERIDGLFDRLYINYEFYNLSDPTEIELSELKNFGWIVGVQYAISRDSRCPIPGSVNGGYCNLFDLTEYVSVEDGFVTTNGNFLLGEGEDVIEARMIELGDFLAQSIPFFIRKIRFRIGVIDGGNA